jgi:Protein of unknown function (DUF732)
VKQFWLGWLAGALSMFLGFYGAGYARGDGNSYLAYLADHHISTAINSPSRYLQAGFFTCDALHAGQTPDQLAASSPFALVDIHGMIDAAQHELCPDTLR